MKKGKLKITKDLFCYTIEQIRLQERAEKEFAKSFEKMFPDSTVMCYNNKTYQALMELLINAMQDDGDWIMYFMYELEYGMKWKKDVANRSNGTGICLATSGDLYDFLMED
jgi:hypothetical protein